MIEAIILKLCLTQMEFEEYKEQALADLGRKAACRERGCVDTLDQRIFGNSVRGRDERPYGVMYRRSRC